ncbi:MAG: HDOD domain-containing protein [Planctomycetes bacterium]|nr:HDOD domain-containing protein [Planctomycetota bacterium]
MADVKKLVSEIEELPTLPVVVAKITELVNSDTTSASDINFTLSKDLALSSRILKIVNSSFYGFPRRINSITQAVVILGFHSIRNLALSSFVFSAFAKGWQSFDNRAFWLHSLATAVAANQIAGLLRVPQRTREDMFIAGLLHDLGKVVMCEYIQEDMDRVLKIVAQQDCLFLDAEAACLEYNHAHLGASLLDSWRLPSSVVELVEFHHQPENAAVESQPCAAIHLADIIARSICCGNGGDNKIPKINPAAWQTLALGWDDVGAVMDHTLAEMKNASAFFEAD